MNNVDNSMTTISEKQSESEANSTIYSKKYDEVMNKLRDKKNTNLKYFISMEL